MVEFKGRFDENKTKSMNAHSLKKLWWLYLLLSVLIVLCGVISIALREDTEDLIFGITFVVLGVLFAPLVFLITFVLQKKVNNSMSVMSSDTTETYQFYPDRLIIKQIKLRSGEEESEYEATTNARYSYLYTVEETRDCYFMRISKMQTHVVYKSDLTQGTIEELNQILQSNLGLKFKRMK